jgi:hypothetical protein
LIDLIDLIWLRRGERGVGREERVS